MQRSLEAFMSLSTPQIMNFYSSLNNNNNQYVAPNSSNYVPNSNTPRHPELLYGYRNIQNHAQPILVGAGSPSINSGYRGTSMHPSLLYGTNNIQNMSQTTIHSGNIHPVAAPVHSPTLHGSTTLPFSIPCSEQLSPNIYIPQSPSIRTSNVGTIQRITIRPAPSAPTTQQNNKGVVINQKVDNIAKQGEKEKEPEQKRRGRGRPPKRQGYDFCKLPITKVQKIGESSSGSEKEQMTSENGNKEDQIASKIDSQERRKEYKNAIFHNNSDWPLDIHLKKFKKFEDSFGK
ncbi:hypothetical protein P8452_25972 [Trifolium repens]|nr:hypothetical protein P8452_25972 [Trifolium repens]